MTNSWTFLEEHTNEVTVWPSTLLANNLIIMHACTHMHWPSSLPLTHTQISHVLSPQLPPPQLHIQTEVKGHGEITNYITHQIYQHSDRLLSKNAKKMNECQNASFPIQREAQFGNELKSF